MAPRDAPQGVGATESSDVEQDVDHASAGTSSRADTPVEASVEVTAAGAGVAPGFEPTRMGDADTAANVAPSIDRALSPDTSTRSPRGGVTDVDDRRANPDPAASAEGPVYYHF